MEPHPTISGDDIIPKSKADVYIGFISILAFKTRSTMKIALFLLGFLVHKIVVRVKFWTNLMSDSSLTSCILPLMFFVDKFSIWSYIRIVKV